MHIQQKVQEDSLIFNHHITTENSNQSKYRMSQPIPFVTNSGSIPYLGISLMFVVHTFQVLFNCLLYGPVTLDGFLFVYHHLHNSRMWIQIFRTSHNCYDIIYSNGNLQMCIEPGTKAEKSFANYKRKWYVTYMSGFIRPKTMKALIVVSTLALCA